MSLKRTFGNEMIFIKNAIFGGLNGLFPYHGERN